METEKTKEGIEIRRYEKKGRYFLYDGNNAEILLFRYNSYHAFAISQKHHIFKYSRTQI